MGKGTGTGASPIVAEMAMKYALELNAKYHIDEHIKAELAQIQNELEFVVLPELERHLYEEVLPELEHQRQYAEAKVVAAYEQLKTKYEAAIEQCKAVINYVNNLYNKTVYTYNEVLTLIAEGKADANQLVLTVKSLHDEMVNAANTAVNHTEKTVNCVVDTTVQTVEAAVDYAFFKVDEAVQNVELMVSLLFADLHADVYCDSKLLSLGDSSATGMGLDAQFDEAGWNAGYKKVVEGSYGKLLADKFEMDYTSLAMGGMRMQDLFFILNTEAQADAYFEQRILKDMASYDGVKEDARAYEHKQYATAIAEADVITVSLGGANFTTYAQEQALSVLTTGKLAYPINFAQYEDAPFAQEVLPRLEQVKQLLLAKEPEKAPVVIAFLSAYVDAYLGACAYVGDTLDAIHAINPAAKVYVLGQTNPLAKIELSYNNYTLDITDFFEACIKVFNLQFYLSTLTRANTQFVDVTGAETHAMIDEKAPTNLLNPALLAYITFDRGVYSHSNANGHAFIAEQVAQYLVDVECEFELSEIVWDGFTAKAVLVCTNDSTHTEEHDCTVTNEVTTVATCSIEGIKTYTATYGKFTDTKEEKLGLDPNNHDLVHHDAKAPTCTEAGWDAYDTCKNCDYTTKVEKHATGHNYANPVITKNATETEDGEVTYTCTKCNATKVEKFRYESKLNADVTTGVSISSNSNSFPAGTEFVIIPLSSSEIAELNNNENIKAVGDNAEVICSFDICALLANTKVQPNGDIQITLPIGDVELGEHDHLTVVFVADDGSIEKFDTTVNKDGTVTFTTNHFSCYALVKTTSPTPVTEQAWFWIVIGAVVLVAAGVVIFVFKKKDNTIK